MSAQESSLAVHSRYVTIQGINTHYLESGRPEEGCPLTLLIHGWPTSSYLWRNILPILGTGGWTVALDLPGYGQTDKPVSQRFDYEFWNQYLDAFIHALGAQRINLVVHDLGGPIGLIWAARHQHQLDHLVLLNTLVYTRLNWSAKLFVLMTKLPVISRWMTRSSVLRATLGLGTRQPLADSIKSHYAKVYQDPDARQCLLTTVRDLDPRLGSEFETALPNLTIPVTGIYGAKDRVLPDIGRTMAKVKRDLPAATIHALPNCGHFLQEDDPEQVARLIGQALWPAHFKLPSESQNQ